MNRPLFYLTFHVDQVANFIHTTGKRILLVNGSNMAKFESYVSKNHEHEVSQSQEMGRDLNQHTNAKTLSKRYSFQQCYGYLLIR